MANDNSEEMTLLKEFLLVALNDGVSQKQGIYLRHYYFDNMNVTSIAAMYNCNKSTVSRVMKSGRKNLYRYLRFASRGLLRGNKCN